jgi:hypothetical protein
MWRRNSNGGNGTTVFTRLLQSL